MHAARGDPCEIFERPSMEIDLVVLAFYYSLLPYPNTTVSSVMETKIYHNPRCSKSRQTLALLHDNGMNPEIIEYLTNPPSHQQLDSLLRGLAMEPRELMRRGEDEYQTLGLNDEALDRNQLIAAMVSHPRLIERPIVVIGDQVALGRPPENVLSILPA